MHGCFTFVIVAAIAHVYMHLVAKLIGLARLALGDALHLGFMHTIDLVLVLPLLCVDAKCCLQLPSQLLRWLRNLPLGLAHNVA